MPNNRKLRAIELLPVEPLNQTEADLRRLRGQQDVIVALGQIALREVPIEYLQAQIVKAIVDNLDVKFCRILRLCESASELVYEAGHGWGKIDSETYRIPVSDRERNHIASRISFSFNNDDPHVLPVLDTLLIKNKIVSGIKVVCQGRGKPYGTLGIFCDYARRFNADETKFLQELANLLGLFAERSQAENERREEAHKFKNLFEGALDGILIANEAACEIFGLTRHELLGRKISDFVAFKADQVEERFQQFKQKQESKGVTTIRRLNGELRQIEFSSTANITAGLHLSIVRDITDQKRIVEERDRFFTVALDLICVASPEGYFTRMNPASITILGYTPG